MTDPTEDAARRLVDTGALHTAACCHYQQMPVSGPCPCEPDVFEVLKAFAREVRRQALEEAAIVAEAADVDEHGGSQCCGGELVVAKRIRALMEPSK